MLTLSQYRKPVTSCLASFLLLCAGCSVGVQSHTETSGAYIGQQSFAQITPGKSKTYVVAVLGDPTDKKTADANTEIWEWSYTEKEITSGAAPFLTGTASNAEHKHTAYVEFDNGVVGKTWRD
ncbi:MAG TPA: outer membrane protein assembly factor BamE [Opitutales bacterium]|jgi:outer membrane protein assembly factor BamE (lipoprotein component of BamABCDE complex)|nr:outer membrane protein assembly factor BamE [Opitutales bacterium]